tara:strand:+ start:26 stop:409 length:384 start_codon:yes stop_codon:yes gene_type:complete
MKELSPLTFIELERGKLDICYICLDEIDHETPAVFIHMCKHHMCIHCLDEICIKEKRDDILKNTSMCGICRALPNKFVMRSKSFIIKQHNTLQSIYIPKEQLKDIYSHPHSDSLQKMIMMGHSCQKE